MYWAQGPHPSPHPPPVPTGEEQTHYWFWSSIFIAPTADYGQKIESEVGKMTLAITNDTLIDGRGGDPQTRMTIVIDGTRISRLGRQNQWQVPREASGINAH